MPYTQQQAQNYLNTLTPAQQAEVQASLRTSGSTLIQWFANAVGAGVPGAVQAGGGGVGVTDPATGQPQDQPGGSNTGTTAQQVRDRGLAAGGSAADIAEWDDAHLNAWLKNYKYDPNTNKFQNIYGDWVFKPDDRGPNTPHNRNGTGDQGDFGWGWNDSGIGGGAPGRGAQVGQRMAGGLLHSTAASALSPEQTRLADLQRVLEDQLLGRQGIFGLADARTGSSGVRTTDIYGQGLEGGGLWWGADKGMFDPNTQPQQQQRRRRRQPAAAPQLPAAAPPPAAPPPPASAPVMPPPRGIDEALYRKFPRGGPFSRWMTQ